MKVPAMRAPGWLFRPALRAGVPLVDWFKGKPKRKTVAPFWGVPKKDEPLTSWLLNA